MYLALNINYFNDMPEEQKEYINALKSKGTLNTKITTNALKIIYDKKDARYIKSLENVKLVFALKNGGCMLLLGNIGCVYTGNFCGEFFCKKVVIEEGSQFDNIKGVEFEIDFSNPLGCTPNDVMKERLQEIANNKNFVFNLSQFDEFMDIFEYYKKLSAELNNNVSYEILNISKEYCFISTDVKEFESDYKEEVYDLNGILIGYSFDEYIYEQLPNEIKDKVQFLCDIEIDAEKSDIKRIKTIGADNIYVSNIRNVGDKDVKQLNQFIVINSYNNKDHIILSGELKNYDDNYQYLNLYDMGQKIKVESIDNSLRLINQGASGAASQLLTYLIGDEPMPDFGTGRLTKDIKPYLEGLNESQKLAFMKCIDGSPVSLIKGPPGTGKTHVINAIVQYITKELNQKVIISSQTHIAIDNVLDKLMTNYDAIIPNRITNRKNKYSGDEIDKTLYKTWGLKFEKHNARVSNEKLAQKILEDMSHFNGQKQFVYSEETDTSDYAVIGATTTTSAIAGKKGLEVLEGYDWLIIDEVSKCPITEVLRYLPYVSRIIMVGDDYQLAPLLEFNKEDVEHLPSYNEDKFEKLQQIYEQSVFADTLNKAIRCNRLAILNENYRSVKDVLACYNVFYDNTLIGKREEVNPNVTQIESKTINNNKNVYFIEVFNGKEAMDGTSRFNLEELEATKEILKRLMKEVVNPEHVSVAAIFPYGAQISKFHKNNITLINEAKKIFKSFDIDTVDAFQGKEADIVLLNTVVADSSKRNFLNDFRRINVSMSRAKDKLFIFGNSHVLSRIEMKKTGTSERKYFKDIIEYIRINGQYIKYDGGIIDEPITSKRAIEFA